MVVVVNDRVVASNAAGLQPVAVAKDKKLVKVVRNEPAKAVNAAANQPALVVAAVEIHLAVAISAVVAPATVATSNRNRTESLRRLLSHCRN